MTGGWRIYLDLCLMGVKMLDTSRGSQRGSCIFVTDVCHCVVAVELTAMQLSIAPLLFNQCPYLRIE